jgi:hypothetical protein
MPGNGDGIVLQGDSIPVFPLYVCPRRSWTGPSTAGLPRVHNGAGPGAVSDADPAHVPFEPARILVRDPAMSEATFAEIKKELSDELMVDLVLTIAFYCAVVRVLATMKIDNEPYYKEVLKQYPIPGVE